jgi:hypothetical protein
MAIYLYLTSARKRCKVFMDAFGYWRSHTDNCAFSCIWISCLCSSCCVDSIMFTGHTASVLFFCHRLGVCLQLTWKRPCWFDLQVHMELVKSSIHMTSKSLGCKFPAWYSEGIELGLY